MFHSPEFHLLTTSSGKVKDYIRFFPCFSQGNRIRTSSYLLPTHPMPSDEPAHLVLSYTPLFSLFFVFLSIADPPPCTMLTWSVWASTVTCVWCSPLLDPIPITPLDQLLDSGPILGPVGFNVVHYYWLLFWLYYNNSSFLGLVTKKQESGNEVNKSSVHQIRGCLCLMSCYHYYLIVHDDLMCISLFTHNIMLKYLDIQTCESDIACVSILGKNHFYYTHSFLHVCLIVDIYIV